MSNFEPNKEYTDHIKNDAESITWKSYARGGMKVDAIKAFRALTGADLMSAKVTVERYLSTPVEPIEKKVHQVINLRDGSTLIIAEETPQVFRLTRQKTEDLGTVFGHELLQQVANLSAVWHQGTN